MLFGSALLAPWKKDADLISFPELRIAEANLTKHVPNTFTISTLDSGNPSSGAVHSPYKQAVGKRAAQGLVAKSAGTVTAQPFMPPQYASSSTTAASGVTVKLSAAGLYGAPPVLQSAACPKAIGEVNCESFAVIDSSCAWHNATASIGTGINLCI